MVDHSERRAEIHQGLWESDRPFTEARIYGCNWNHVIMLKTLFHRGSVHIRKLGMRMMFTLFQLRMLLHCLTVLAAARPWKFRGLEDADSDQFAINTA